MNPSSQQASINQQYSQQLAEQHRVQQMRQHYREQQQAQAQAQLPSRRRRAANVNKAFPTVVSATMRDRQARGKNAYKKHEDDLTDEEADDDEELEDEEGMLDEEEEEEEDDDDDDDDDYDDLDDTSKTTTSSIFSCQSEAFETRERRAYALAVLDRPEQLMMYANTTNDSIASQRLRFTAMMCGFEEEADWRNNAHFKSTLLSSREKQQLARNTVSAASVDMSED